MEPPPSQSDLAVGHSSVFINQDGSSIPIFTEACSIKGRPKLMRMLRNFGASLCCDPKSAQIILVDQETTDGKKFIRNWGRDKVVLHYAWAKKSIQEGKALLEDCNWGECFTVDDGLPIETEDNDEPQLNNPLPTPRVTPVESKTSRSAGASRLSNPVPDTPTKQDWIMPPLSQTPLGSNDVPAPATTPNISQNMLPISPMPINSFPQTPYTMQMPNMGSMAPQMTPMMAQMTQYIMMMMNSSSNYPYNSQAQQPTDFNSALIDALRVHNVQWPNTQPPPPAPQESPLSSDMYDHQTTSQLSTNQSYPYLDPSPDSQSTAMEVPIRKKRRASTASASSDSLPARVASESKRKTASPPSKRHKASPPATQSSSERKLFRSKSGKELSFFVQVEMHNRSGVVTAIKKHGGKIEGNNEIADYAILASGASKTKTFKDLLVSTVAAGRPALSARFVHDCVAQDTLLDTGEYAFESPPIKSRKRTVTTQDDDSFDEMEGRRLAKNARRAARRQRLREEAAQSSSQQGSSSQKISTPAHSPPSPTPPPQHTREMVGGNYRFTDSERIYAMKYMEVLLARNHEISGQAMGVALHNKMPHHSAASWRSHLGLASIRDDVDRLRKRAGILFRKTQEQTLPQASQSAPEACQQDRLESEPEDAIVITPSPTLVDESVTDKKTAEEDDLNAVAKFFVGNQDENENESVVWARLTSQAKCKTANSWEEFYDLHHEEVVKRYEMLYASQFDT